LRPTENATAGCDVRRCRPRYRTEGLAAFNIVGQLGLWLLWGRIRPQPGTVLVRVPCVGLDHLYRSIRPPRGRFGPVYVVALNGTTTAKSGNCRVPNLPSPNAKLGRRAGWTPLSGQIPGTARERLIEVLR